MSRRLALFRKVPYVRIIGLVLIVAAVVSAYEYAASPMLGVLFVLGVVAAGLGLGKRKPKNTVTVLALVAAAIAVGSAPQTASAWGGPYPPLPYSNVVPLTCAMHGPPEPGHAYWWQDPLYKSCIGSGPQPEWLRRCAVGALGAGAGTAGAYAVNVRTIAAWAAKVGEVTPVGLVIGLSTGCVLYQIKP